MFFRGSWPQFAEDHDLHQGFFYALQLPLWYVEVWREDLQRDTVLEEVWSRSAFSVDVVCF
jgi:hypothetical protein